MIQTLIDNYEDNNDIYNLNKDKNEIKIGLEDKNKKEKQNKECNIDDEDKISYSDINDEDKYCSFNTIRKIEKVYHIGRVRGDGKCLFYTLSFITLGTDAYFNEVRTAICDYMEKHKNIFVEIKKEEEIINYIKKNKKKL